MPKLMGQHNQEQRQILRHAPAYRRIAAALPLDLPDRHQKPRPVQIQIHPGKAKQMNRTPASTWHAESLLHPGKTSRKVVNPSPPRFVVWASGTCKGLDAMPNPHSPSKIASVVVLSILLLPTRAVFSQPGAQSRLPAVAAAPTDDDLANAREQLLALLRTTPTLT